jgi:hypothetical protein
MTTQTIKLESMRNTLLESCHHHRLEAQTLSMTFEDLKATAK